MKTFLGIFVITVCMSANWAMHLGFGHKLQLFQAIPWLIFTCALIKGISILAQEETTAADKILSWLPIFMLANALVFFVALALDAFTGKVMVYPHSHDLEFLSWIIKAIILIIYVFVLIISASAAPVKALSK